MTDRPEPAPMQTETAPDPIWTRLSVIWLVPILALAVTLGVAWKTYAERGELIEIELADATGITPGETPLKFREVQVGTVESVGFSPDLASVRVFVRVDNKVAQYIDQDARFWLVRPEVSAQGISRLDTVLSGTFIEGWWDAVPNGHQTVFRGLDRPPVAPDPSKGTAVELVADNAGGLAEGAPVLYRGLTVGRLQNLRLDDKGAGVAVDAYIEAPYDKRLSSVTRFWNTSGASVSIGAAGVQLSVASLASLVQGGVEFETFSTGGGPVDPGQRFRLYGSSDDARQSMFGAELTDPPKYTLLFDQAINGLSKGSKVQFRGVEAGEVTDVSIRIRTDAKGERSAQQQVVIALSPERLGLDRDSARKDVNDFLAAEVEKGLRARVAATGLLGTTLVIELTDIEATKPAKMDLGAEPWPEIPTAPAAQNDLAASAKDVMGRINNLPIEELMKSAIRTFDSVSAVAESQDTREIPRNLSSLLGQLQTLVADLNAAGAAGKAVTAMDNLSSAATGFMTETDGLSQTLASADKAAQAVAAMPLGRIGDNVDGMIAEIRAMLGSEDANKLPKALADTLNETAALLAELRAGGAADNLNGTLVATQNAATAISDASTKLPALTERLDQLVTQAQGLVGSYGPRSAFNDQMVQTLTELRRAAASFGELARTLQRNPQSVILGR